MPFQNYFVVGLLLFQNEFNFGQCNRSRTEFSCLHEGRAMTPRRTRRLVQLHGVTPEFRLFFEGYDALVVEVWRMGIISSILFRSLITYIL